MKSLKFNLKEWNKEVFGRLKVNIGEVEIKLMDAQTAFDSSPCDSILLDLNSAKPALHNLLNAESTLWKQRAKIRWLQDGDRNTKFFHLSSKSRGIQNRIDRISVGGTLFEVKEDIKDQASVSFSNLLRSSSVIPEEALFGMTRPSVSLDQNKLLTAIPSSTKIREAVF